MEYLASLLTYNFISNLAQISWQDILLAIQKQFVSREFAIQHAMSELAISDEYPQTLVDLASLNKNDDIHPYIDELASMEPELRSAEFSEKWLYLILAWVYKNRDTYPNPLEIVEQIYADFDYPDSISGFVRYMPSEGPNLGSLEKNNNRLFDKWKIFLDSQRGKYC